VNADVKGATIWVDGMEYKTGASFSWVVGSRHIIEMRSGFQMIGDGRSRLSFGGWEISQGTLVFPSSPVQIVTVGPTSVSYTARFVTEHRVMVWLDYDTPRNLLDPTAGEVQTLTDDQLPLYANKNGFVSVGGLGACGSRPGIATTTWSWQAQGTVLNPVAYPYPGRVFSGWQNPPGPVVNGGPLIVNGPMDIRARFNLARRVYLDSSPVKELKVLVDNTTMYTRGDKCWPDWSNFFNPNAPDPPKPPDYFPPTNQPPPSNSGDPTSNYGFCTMIPLCNGEIDLEPGSAHVFAAPVSQADRSGKIWIFDHWNFGTDKTGGQNSSVTIPQDWSAHTFTAHFVPGLRASFVTVPSGLKLKIDGRENWPAYNFDWGLGHQHKISAPLEQVDAKGRRFRFVGWSNDGPADQDITVAEDPMVPGGFRLIARYEQLGQLTLHSEPSSLTFDVDGTECRTPCTLDRPEGTEVAINALPDVAMSPDTKAVFEGWTDGTAEPARAFKFTTGASTFTARYRYLHKLTSISDPEDGTNWVLDPEPEGDGYFPVGTRLSLTAEPRRGFKFRRFEGALTGLYNSGWLTMNTPATVVARLEKVPALDENSVRNAAGETPESVVAPGSLISVVGVNMAPAAERGPDSPLTQTLQGLVLDLGGRMLPLVSASPEEIIAQLPSDLNEGDYTLTVRSTSQSPLTARFSVARNAPGLFRAPEATAEIPLARALHQDGQPVTVENPARVGETISLLGTGFGPVDPTPLDGFAVPSSPPAPLKDMPELMIGGEVRPHSWCGAAPDRVGYSLLRFKVDATMGQSQNLDVRVRINGRESNAVLLPVQ